MTSLAQIVADLRRHVEQRPHQERDERPDVRDDQDAGYRAAYGTKPFGHALRAAFYQYLPPAPVHLAPQPDACRAYVGQIDDCIERGCWSRNERLRLRRLRATWDRRAQGRDVRYLIAGNRPGRVAADRGHTHPQSVFQQIQDILQPGRARTPVPAFVDDVNWPLGRPNAERWR